MDGVIASQNQPIGLPYIFALEIQNQNMNMKVQLSKGTEEIRHKFIKQKTGE